MLFHGNCLDIIPDLPQVDLIICDLPFGMTQCDWDKPIDLEHFWRVLKYIRRVDTPVASFGLEPFSSSVRSSNLSDFKYDWIWEKSKATGFLNAKHQPLRAHETISIFYSKRPTFNPQMTTGKPYNKGVRKRQTKNDIYGDFSEAEIKSAGERYPRSVLKFTTAEREGGFHKSQKPVALLEYLIKTYTNEGDIVFDPTMGAGSTGVAALNTGRKFIGCEMDLSFFECAERRISCEGTPS